MSQIVDAAVLERAAVILRERSSKPNSVTVGALCRTLTDVAAKIRTEVIAAADPGDPAADQNPRDQR